MAKLKGGTRIYGDIKIDGGIYDSSNQVGVAGSVLISTGVGIAWTSSAGSGAQGGQGIQGVQGLSNQGSQGLQGAQGRQGAQGAQGVQGLQGLSNQGAQGIQGLQSAQGSQGLQGPAGTTQGSQGTQGLQGAQGVQGLQGLSNQGAQGIQGLQSAQGAQGLQGLSNQGAQGLQGAQGRQGAQGTQGLQGLQGLAGTTQGTQGLQGAQGVQGLQGLSNQGSQGTQGLQGAQGVQGLQGLSNQGSQGTQGLQGAQGVQGLQGLSNQGTQGLQGAQGRQGGQGTQGLSNQGLQGASGSGGSISPWTVKTTTYTAVNGDRIVADTSSAPFTINLPATPTTGDSVTFADGNDWITNNLTVGRNGSTIEGIVDDFVLDIKGIAVEFVYDGATWELYASTGPAGLQGRQGAQGLQGAQGRQGAQGTQGLQGLQGLQGVGSQGSQGLQGAQGVQGLQGLSNQGAQGTQGLQGAQGRQGAQGTQGLQGLQGLQGVGSQGLQGLQGAAGPATTINATDDTTTATLYPVMVGATGSNQTAKARSTATALAFNASTNVLSAGGLLVNKGSLGTTAGVAISVSEFLHNNGNASYLRIKATRSSAGADWTTASTKLLQVIDVTEMGYVEYNPSGSTFGMAFGQGSTEWARFLSAGNLGIGTTNPTSKLHVIGAIKATSSIDSDTQFLGQPNDTATTPSFSWTGDTTTGFYRPSSGNLAFTINGTERVRFNDTGVGIGTTNPTYRLHVVSGGSAGVGQTIAYFTNANNSDRISIIDENSSNRPPGIRSRLAAFGLGLYADNGPIIFYNGAGDNARARFDTSGNFLINTTTATGTASQLLQVSGGAYISGNVGLGTTNPSGNLHIASNAPTITLTDYNSAANEKRWINAVDATTLYWQALNDAGSGGGNLFRMTRSSEQINNFDGLNSGIPWFTINNNTQRVGIGSTIPTSKLTITGDVSVSGVITCTDINSTSDINLKDNIETFTNALDIVNDLRGVRFEWKENGKPSVGIVAQELEKVLPELVNGSDPKTVNYNGLIGVLIEAIKEQQRQINILNERIEIIIKE